MWIALHATPEERLEAETRPAGGRPAGYPTDQSNADDGGRSSCSPATAQAPVWESAGHCDD
jgi:hypothetical protein